MHSYVVGIGDLYLHIYLFGFPGFPEYAATKRPEAASLPRHMMPDCTSNGL